MMKRNPRSVKRNPESADRNMQNFQKASSFHVSRFKFSSRYILFVFLFAVGVVSFTLNYSRIIYVSSLVISVLGIAMMELKIRSNKVIADHGGLIIASGLFSKKQTKINYRSISDIRIQQSAFQRFFGYGNMEIGVPGSNLTQNFSGRGDVKIDNLGGLNSGVALNNFQKIKLLEIIISSKISRHGN